MIEISEEKIKKIVSNILEKTKELNESQTNSLINSIVKKEVSSALISEKDLFEGIKYDVYTRTVEYSPIENNVNTSIQDNPSVDITEIYPNVQVWSIFQRKNTPGLIGYDNKDGNPLLYAFKGEDGWKFKTQKDKNKFIYLFEQLVKKFLATHNSDITVVIPSGSPVNMLIANTIKQYKKDTNIVNDLLRKLTVEEVWENIDALDSPFRKKFGRTRHDYEDAMNDMKKAFNKMKQLRNGKFTYHFLPINKPYREYITQSLACDEFSRGKYAKEIYQHNILLLDDSISRGQTIKNACDILNSFQPKSITVLTMFSKRK